MYSIFMGSCQSFDISIDNPSRTHNHNNTEDFLNIVRFTFKNHLPH